MLCYHLARVGPSTRGIEGGGDDDNYDADTDSDAEDSQGSWCIKLKSSTGNLLWARLPCADLMPPSKVPLGSWEILDKSGLSFVLQPSVVSSSVLVAHSHGVVLSGATPAMCPESFVSIINGIYEPTTEFQCGVTVFKRVDMHNVFLCYFDNEWRVQNAEQRGKVTCFAKVASPLSLPYDAPLGAVWNVSDSNLHRPRPEIGAKRVLLASAGVQIRGVTVALTSASTAAKINGFYEPVVGESCGGASVYRKGGASDDAAIFITYNDEVLPNGWVVQSKANKGTGRGYAHMVCGLLLPDKAARKCGSTTWIVQPGEMEGVPESFRGEVGERMRVAVELQTRFPGLSDVMFAERLNEWLNI